MSKGAETRERILDRALRVASRDGLDGLSIGGLADELGLSKSGLFAHFGSKEDLQLEVLRSASERFEDLVVRPALKAPRGAARLRRMFELWLRWAAEAGLPGGCIFAASAFELDDRAGRPREFLVSAQRQFVGALARGARIAVEVGDFRDDVDVDQFAFELYALVLGYIHAARLLGDPGAEARTRTAFERLLASAARVAARG